MKKILFVIIFNVFCIHAQVQWACKVAYTNDQFTDDVYPGQFEPKKALDVPEVYPSSKKANGFSYLMGYKSSEKDIELKVEFCKPMIAEQVVIVEPWGAGAVTKVVVESDGGKQSTIYEGAAFTFKEKSRIWHLPTNFKKKIKYVTIYGSPSKDGEWNCIDGIGITPDSKPVTCEINLSKTTLFIGERKSVSAKINSQYTEVVPIISPDKKTLYFDRQDHPSNMLFTDNTIKDDIWYSIRQSDGEWGEPIHADKPINNKGNNFVNSISPDGNTLVLGNQYGSDGEISGQGISISKKEANGKWGLPQNLQIPGFANTSKYFDFFMSNSLDIIVMSVENDKSYGSSDIFVSFLSSDGKWSVPENIGNQVNTPYDDDTPVLASDNKTLYFASKGYYGYGEDDIYMTKRLDDTWKNWSTPINLGPQINTGGGDMGFTIPADGKDIYLYSYSNETKSSDIFVIDIHKDKEIKPEAVILVSGHVYDSKTKKPIQRANIAYSSLEDNKPAGQASSSPSDGSYKIVLPVGEHYGFFASMPGYISIHEYLETKETLEYQEIHKDLYLTPIEKGQSIVLNNIFFERSKAVLLSTSFTELDEVVKMLINNPKMNIRIDGHTDNVGSEDLLIQLSQNRANSIETYLVGKGISTKRIDTKAFGSSKPIASNAKEETRKLNRRVEFTILDL